VLAALAGINVVSGAGCWISRLPEPRKAGAGSRSLCHGFPIEGRDRTPRRGDGTGSAGSISSGRPPVDASAYLAWYREEILSPGRALGPAGTRRGGTDRDTTAAERASGRSNVCSPRSALPTWTRSCCGSWTGSWAPSWAGTAADCKRIPLYTLFPWIMAISRLNSGGINTPRIPVEFLDLRPEVPPDPEGARFLGRSSTGTRIRRYSTGCSRGMADIPAVSAAAGGTLLCQSGCAEFRGRTVGSTGGRGKLSRRCPLARLSRRPSTQPRHQSEPGSCGSQQTRNSARGPGRKWPCGGTERWPRGPVSSPTPALAPAGAGPPVGSGGRPRGCGNPADTQIQRTQGRPPQRWQVGVAENTGAGVCAPGTNGS